jgi:zinc D-Ala-D-Ala carboxypeptidase
MELENFKLSEFDSPDQLGSGSKMNPDFLERLDKARAIAGIPFKINSGYRTEAHNKKVGGEPNSAHTKGFAADIAYSGGSNGYKILTALMQVGFTRLGIYKTWIHCDSDPSLPSKVIWSK